MAATLWTWADFEQVGSVYLLHFHPPGEPEVCSTLGGWGRYGAQHYVGWALDLEARMREHRSHSGRGAKVVRELLARGLDFSVVRVWEGATKELENRIKMSGRYRDACPICVGTVAYRRKQHTRLVNLHTGRCENG